MSHTVHHKEKLTARVSRIRGQIDAVERALQAEVGCAEVMRQLASIRGALNGLTAEVMEDHLRGHLLAAETDADRRQAGEELLQVMRTYFK